MKYVLIIGDGMADYAVPELGNLTPLQAACKPNIDAIAAKGRSGLLRTVPETCTPGSDTAILSILGYSPLQFAPARGALEAAARGIVLKENDVAFRCNLVTEKNGVLTDYAAGHISSSEAAKLIEVLRENLEKPGVIEFFTGLDYRHFLVLRNCPFSQYIECTPPHDAVGVSVKTILPKAKLEEAKRAVSLLIDAIQSSKSILESHPVNVTRRALGKLPGNMIWPWGGGARPLLPLFKEKYGLDAAVISAVDLVKGIGKCLGMRVIDVEGATGLADTNYEGKADAALDALRENNFVFVHVEAPDEAGHIRDYRLKVKTIEDLDKRLVGRLLDGLSEPYAIAVLPDHPTPIVVGTHTRDPVPFVIQSPYWEADDVQKLDEVSAKNGGFGLVEDASLISLLLSCKENGALYKGL
ncbi:MAG: cofactor-independent phosphoglycerate mutase [Candidatus Bathyarchaeia archaeon]